MGDLDSGSVEMDPQLVADLERLWTDSSQSLSGPSTGQVVGNYRIRSVLGSGAFAVVYLADNIQSDRPVALKLPRPEVLIDAEHRQRFVAEAEILKSIDHPNIIKIYEVFSKEPFPYIAMEWCHGPDLGHWLATRSKNGIDDWRSAIALMADVAEAVDQVHKQGITHRDLKPANILLEPKIVGEDDGEFAGGLDAYQAKVSDFGLAKSLDVSLNKTRSSLILGTPLYMAPEQFDFDRNSSEKTLRDSPAIDIYSIGAILFELLTGRPPVEGDHFFELVQKLRNTSTPRLRSVLYTTAKRSNDNKSGKNQTPSLPAEVADDPAPLSKLETICATCLHKNPEGRYGSGSEVAEDLRRCLNGQPLVGRQLNAFEKYKFWHANQAWHVTAGRFAIVFSILMVLWLAATVAGSIFYNVMTKENYVSMMGDTFSLLLASTIPMGVVGWLCLKGRRFPIMIGLLLCIPSLIAAISGMAGVPLAFKDFYHSSNIFFCFQIHLFIFLGYATQELLFLFAWLERRSLKQ